MAGNIRKKIDDKKYSLQFLPESLLPISNLNRIEHNGTNLKIPYVIDVIHNLLLKYYFKKENLFNLSSLILRDKYGDKYNYYISYLKENGHIKLVMNHQKGKNARIYKLSDDIIFGKILRYKNNDKILMKKYKNNVSQIDSSNRIKSQIRQEVKQRLVYDLFNVQIDFERSIFYLDSIIQDTDIYNRNKYSVECIKDKHIFYHFDTYGRMHTNFTILKSFIRKNCLLIDGEATSEVDIKNSQPLFLCKLINNVNPNFINKSEFETFKYLTTNGLFYQYLIDNSDIKEKKKVKELVYKVLFGKNLSGKGDSIFKKLFPTVYKFIKFYKEETGNYRTLSHDLQKAESNFIFNKVVYELIKKYPDIKILTIHDSIIFQSKYKDSVKEIFDEYLINEILSF
jgi:hypothetical protein